MACVVVELWEMEPEDLLAPGGSLAQVVPGYEDRPEQREMASAVGRILAEGGMLLVEAGPGTGKTFAYLVPAILLGKRVVISTATKTLQEQIYYRDLPLLAKVPSLKFNAAYMKGRENYLCLRRLQRALRQPPLEGMEGELREIVQWAGMTKTGDRSELDLPEDFPLWRWVSATRDGCLGGDCPYQRECFITKMRQRAAAASIVVVNHHLLMADLAVRDLGVELIPRLRAVVFDEAHRLEEVATEYFGLRVSNYRLEELRRDARDLLGNKGQGVLRALAEATEGVFAPFRRAEGTYRLRSVPLEVSRAFKELRRVLGVLREELSGADPAGEAEAIKRRSMEIEGELEFILLSSDPEYVRWCEVRGKGVFLHASPLDASKELRLRLYPRLRSAVFTSATLTIMGSFSWFKSRLGIGETEELILPSPFDWGQQAVLYIPRDLPDVNSPEFLPLATREVEKILGITKGRALLLFTSYRNMEGMAKALRGRIPFKVFLQGEGPKTKLLEEFRRDTSSVLLATASFWEGIDVKGEALSCLIIDRLPFDPPTDPILEARCERIAREGGNPFLEYQLPMAVLTLRQGMGRLIRSRSDRGVLVLLDNRVLKRAYGKTFLRSLPPVEVVTDFEGLKRAARRLWNGSV